MVINPVTKLDKSYKKLSNLASTSVTKQLYEESRPSQVTIHAEEVWAEDPDTHRLQYTQYILTADPTVGGGYSWLAVATPGTPTSVALRNWIPPSYGTMYQIRIFENTGTEIFPPDGVNWVFDYNAGTLYLQEGILSKVVPLKISGYRYTGEMVSDRITGGNLWNKVGTILFPTTAGDSAHIDTNSYYYHNTANTVYSVSTTGNDLSFKDTFLTAAMPISETGTIALDPFFTGNAASIVKALNFLATDMSYLIPSNPLSLIVDNLSFAGTKATSTAYLSGGAGQNFSFYAAGNSILTTNPTSSVVEAGAKTLSTPNITTTFDKADIGTLTCTINGVLVDSFNLSTAFIEANRSGSQGALYNSGGGIPATSANGFITVTSVEWYNSWPPFQKGNARININAATNLRQGENSIVLSHTGITPVETSPTYYIFYDNAGTRPISSTPQVVQLFRVSSRALSGVKYYSIGDTFTITLVLSNAFNNTYVPKPIVSTNNCGWVFPSVGPGDVGTSGYHTPPEISDSLNYTGILTTTLPSVYTVNGRISSQGVDPFGSEVTPVYSANDNRLINTYSTTTSTATQEFFVDESYRLLSTAVQGVPGPLKDYVSVPVPGDSWNSSNSLGEGEAQCYNMALYFPTINFSGGIYLPVTVPAQPNYSGFSLAISKYYVRVFTSNPAIDYRNGTLTLTGWSYANIQTGGSPIAKVELKIPGTTGWKDLSVYYTNPAGSGCLTSVSGNNFSYTLWDGVKGTFGNGNVLVRISLLSNSATRLTGMTELFLA